MGVQPLMFPWAGSGGQLCVWLLDKVWHIVMFFKLQAVFSVHGRKLRLMVGRQASLLHRRSYMAENVVKCQKDLGQKALHLSKDLMCEVVDIL